MCVWGFKWGEGEKEWGGGVRVTNERFSYTLSYWVTILSENNLATPDCFCLTR